MYFVDTWTCRLIDSQTSTGNMSSRICSPQTTLYPGNMLATCWQHATSWATFVLILSNTWSALTLATTTVAAGSLLVAAACRRFNKTWEVHSHHSTRTIIPYSRKYWRSIKFGGLWLGKWPSNLNPSNLSANYVYTYYFTRASARILYVRNYRQI